MIENHRKNAADQTGYFALRGFVPMPSDPEPVAFEYEGPPRPTRRQRADQAYVKLLPLGSATGR
jgi:hypothetical protein